MKGLRKALLIGMTLGVTMLGTIGCMNQDSASSNDVLKVGAISFAGTLEPTENYFSWAVVRFGIGETLIKFDDQMKATPWLATSWKQGDDKLTWTFTINDKVKFSNGNSLTAEAVKASLERTFAKSKRAKTFFNYTEITANGQELTIKTDKEYYNLPNLLGDPLFLIMDVTAEANGRDIAKEGPIGTGPYVVSSFTKERAELKRNDNYWDGKAGFAKVEIPSINDANTRAMALQSGDVDMAISIGPRQQLPHIKGLGQIIVGSGIQPSDFVVDFRLGGEQQYRCGIVRFSHLDEHRNTVHHRHHNVQNRSIIKPAEQIVQRVVAVIHRFCRIMILL